VLTIVGEVLTLQRQWTRAEKTLRIVLDIQKKFLPESHPDCIRTLARLGECWLYQGNFHTAKGFLEKALNSCKSTLHNHPERGKVLLAMGQQHVHGNSRNWAEAATCLTEAVRILGQSLGGHPITATASCELSECMTALGVATDATEVLIRALPVRTESLVSSSLSRRPGCEESQLELEVEALKHENGSLRQRLKQEQGSYQEEIRKLHSRCEMLEEQVSQLQAQQRDINLQDQQLFKMKQEVEYQSIRILFQQKAIRTHSERNDELLGKIEFLERNCRITEKRRLSIEQACREYQQKLMRYDNILTIPAEDVEVKEDLVLGEGSYGGTVVND
jgi:tetratricopeptide (TPR) repeat protein